ncbi:MAG TPA: hypothetical protein ENJ50_11435 [Planctomycetaceae bacterium]|nr:hypothetical protein [Planctomycetaceae bacterium]
MDLEQFVETVLVQVLSGIQKAAEACEEGELGHIDMSVFDGGGTTVKRVSFDVAVTTISETASGSTGAVKVWGLGVHGESSSSTTDQTVSRIKFEVPIAFPYSRNTRKARQRRSTALEK